MPQTRRKFILKSSQTAGALFLSHFLLGQSIKLTALESQSFVDAAFKMNHIRGNVGYFSERGGTIGWMLDKEGIVVVDTQFPDQSNHLIEEIKKVNDRKIDLLINTHHHGDHTSGNIAFKGIVKNHLAHENSKLNQERVAKNKGNLDTTLLPIETFKDKITKKIGTETITMHYFGAAHTNGDAVTHFENANVVHTGDLVFNRKFPYIDKSAGANIENWILVLEETLKVMDSDTQYIFGHSANGHDILGTGEDLKAFQNYLHKLLGFGRKSGKGKSLDEFKSSTKSIPGASEWKGEGIERSLVAVHAEVNS